MIPKQDRLKGALTDGHGNSIPDGIIWKHLPYCELIDEVARVQFELAVNIEKAKIKPDERGETLKLSIKSHIQ